MKIIREDGVMLELFAQNSEAFNQVFVAAYREPLDENDEGIESDLRNDNAKNNGLHVSSQ